MPKKDIVITGLMDEWEQIFKLDFFEGIFQSELVDKNGLFILQKMGKISRTLFFLVMQPSLVDNFSEISMNEHNFWYAPRIL